MAEILTRNIKVEGLTQRELADAWGIKNNSTATDDSPLFSDDFSDPRGRRGSLERHENFQEGIPDGVTFLGGSVVEEPQNGEPVAPATRTIVRDVETTYFAPLINTFIDNTTDDITGFGGYALTQRHYRELVQAGITPNDASLALGLEPNSAKTLRELASIIIEAADGQSIAINGVDATPSFVNSLRQRTRNFSYDALPRATGEIYAPDKIVADPDLGINLGDDDPSNDSFPTVGELNPDFENHVIPFVQEGFYFGATLDSETETLEFGGSLEALFGDAGIQKVSYNFLNPINGGSTDDLLIGTVENDYIEGSAGSDRLIGRKGDDLLLGGTGNDVVNGGRGNDELWGDEGVDKFVFGSRFGNDTIFDFEVGEKVVLRNLATIDSIEDVTLGNGLSAAQIQFNDQDILTLVGVDANSLNVDLDNRMIT